MSLKKRLLSFKYALEGLKVFLQTQVNAWIHIVSFLLVLLIGCYFRISTIEWMMIIIVSGLVIITEIINTSIEFLSDHVSPEHSEQVKKVKDLAAAAVLMASLLAVVIGILIFWNRIF